MSTTTASTLPVSESSYRGPRGPSHPYGLYQQSGGVEPDGVQASAIPLGFRGLPDQYQRRVGPDGEEIADMIGPDGHTEQLPPYTRYPDDAYARKVTAMAANPPDAEREGATIVTPIVTTSASAIPAIAGAGGLGLATRNPEFEPADDDPGSPRSRLSTRSFTSDDSARRIRLDDEGLSEKKPPPKKWQAWMRRKLWGVIPYWAICLTALVLLVIAAILGAVIGTFLAKQKRPPRKESAWYVCCLCVLPHHRPLVPDLLTSTGTRRLTRRPSRHQAISSPYLPGHLRCPSPRQAGFRAHASRIPPCHRPGAATSS